MPRKPRGYWLEQRQPSGVWYVAWTADRRKQSRSCGTRDQGEAEEWLARFLAALEQPEQPERATVGQVLDGYLEDRTGKVVDWARLDLCARHLKRRMGWLAAEDLRPSHSRTYASARAKDGVGDGTIRKELITLRSALRWAAAERWIDALPGVPAPPKPRPRERWLTREEAAALQEAAISPHIRLFIAHRARHRGPLRGDSATCLESRSTWRPAPSISAAAPATSGARWCRSTPGFGRRWWKPGRPRRPPT